MYKTFIIMQSSQRALKVNNNRNTLYARSIQHIECFFSMMENIDAYKIELTLKGLKTQRTRKGQISGLEV